MRVRPAHRRAAVVAICVLAALLGRTARAEQPSPAKRRFCGSASTTIEDPKPTPGDHIVVPPKPRPTNVAPRLPKGAKGTTDTSVVINAHVTRHGDVDVIDVSAGSEPLVSEVVKAVCRWKYEPATLDGSPFPVWKAIRIQVAPQGS